MISRKETGQLKGIAIISMLLLHLFCNLEPNYTPLVYVTGVPLAYFFGQAADFCVFAYCFVSGYALMTQYDNAKNPKAYMKGRLKSLSRFLVNFWVILILFAIIAIALGKGTEWLASPKVFLGNFATLWYSYNGAWWFVSTYIFMVLLSPLVFKALNKRPVIVSAVSAIVYIGTYLIRFKFSGGGGAAIKRMDTAPRKIRNVSFTAFSRKLFL